MPSYNPRQCEFCGAIFAPKKCWEVTCSDKCRNERRKLQKYRQYWERMKALDDLEWANYRIEWLLTHKTASARELEENFQKASKELLEYSLKLSEVESQKLMLEQRLEKMALELARSPKKADAPKPAKDPEQSSEKMANENAPKMEDIKPASVTLREVSPAEAMPVRKMRKCANCGDEFESRDPHERFCCTDCRLEARELGLKRA